MTDTRRRGGHGTFCSAADEILIIQSNLQASRCWRRDSPSLQPVDINKTGNVRIKVRMGRVRVTIIAVEKQ
jgi:hypothetical protein